MGICPIHLGLCVNPMLIRGRNHIHRPARVCSPWLHPPSSSMFEAISHRVSKKRTGLSLVLRLETYRLVLMSFSQDGTTQIVPLSMSKPPSTRVVYLPPCRLNHHVEETMVEPLCLGTAWIPHRLRSTLGAQDGRNIATVLTWKFGLVVERLSLIF